MFKLSSHVRGGVVSVSGRRRIVQLILRPSTGCPEQSLRYMDHSFSRETRGFSTGVPRNNHDHNTASTYQNQDSDNPKDVSPTHGTQTTPAPQGQLSIVFTDIVKSTAMWEKKSSAMATAMQTHDDILRTLTQAHQGYEVKQNGDGFMIAFATAVSALQFCLAVQQQLLDQEWPAELLQLPPAKEVPDTHSSSNTNTDTDDSNPPLFRGLSLRMSAHWGTPITNYNTTIHRMDYLGPMVNRAARFIQVAEGGQIVISDDFLHEIRKHRRKPPTESDDEEIEAALDPDRLQNGEGQRLLDDQRFEVRSLGEHRFKGLDEAQKLWFVVPLSLRGRVGFWPRGRYIPGSKGNIVVK